MNRMLHYLFNKLNWVSLWIFLARSVRYFFSLKKWIRNSGSYLSFLVTPCHEFHLAFLLVEWEIREWYRARTFKDLKNNEDDFIYLTGAETALRFYHKRATSLHGCVRASSFRNSSDSLKLWIDFLSILSVVRPFVLTEFCINSILFTSFGLLLLYICIYMGFSREVILRRNV